MAVTQDIQLIRGETLSITFPVGDDLGFWENPCNLELHVRMTRAGRRFAKLSSESGNLDFALQENETVVRIWATGEELHDIPAITYVYDLYAQCDDAKRVVCRGFFTLEDNAVNAGNLGSVGQLKPEDCKVVGGMSVAFLGDDLNLDKYCDEPLMFEVNAGSAISKVMLSTDLGQWRFWVYEGGRWIRQAMLNTTSRRVRVEYIRFPKHRNGRGSAWHFQNPVTDFGEGRVVRQEEHDRWRHNVQSPYNRDFSDFSITILATDVDGNTVTQKFQASVDGKSLISNGDSTPRGFVANPGTACTSEFSSGELVETGFETFSCNTFPASAVLLGAI